MIDQLLGRLDKVRRVGQGRWMARCPAHEDKSPSLSIRETDDGTVLIRDFGGCGASEILNALGLDYSALFPPKPLEHGKPIQRPVFREDVFQLIQLETTVIWLIGCDMHKVKQISETDYQRLGEAVAKLERIRGAAYGSR